MKTIFLAASALFLAASSVVAAPPYPNPYSRQCPTLNAAPPYPNPYSRQCPTLTDRVSSLIPGFPSVK
jgi:hypothetical protein